MAQLSTRRTLIIAIGIAVAVAGGLYIYMQSYDLLRGPILEIESPQRGERVSDSLVAVVGYAQNISFIEMNDRQIFINENGKFEEQLLLSYGYNIITVTAQDRFGRSIKRTLELVYQ